MKLNCIIVDDEPLALDILEDYIRRTPVLELVGRFTNSSEALALLSAMGGDGGKGIDLVFLDIQMPGLGGLELAKSVGEARVIFTTAFPQYALEGLKADALDYLLKPIGFAEFSHSVERALAWFEIKRSADRRSAAENEPRALIVKSDYKQFVIPTGTITCIEGVRDYIRIHTLDRAGHTDSVQTLMNMKSIEELLPEGRFARVHRSWIVNLDRIARIERGHVVLDVPAVSATSSGGSNGDGPHGSEPNGPDGKGMSWPVVIPISESYKSSFMRMLSSRAL